MGGKSLRHTAIEVYGQGPDSYGTESEEEHRARDDARAWAYYPGSSVPDVGQLYDQVTVVLDEVGGRVAWKALLSALRAAKGG